MRAGGGDDRVERGVGAGGVAGAAGQDDVELVGRGGGGAAGVAESADRHFGAVVEGEGEVGAVGGTGFDHGLGAALDGFLGGLEDEADAAVEAGREADEDLADAEEGRGMDVVAAGVHAAGDCAGEGQAGLFGDGQGVHVGADEEGGTGGAAFDLGGNAVAADAGFRDEAEAAEVGSDQGGGAWCVHAEFGVGVDVAADVDEGGLDGGDASLEEGGEIVHAAVVHRWALCHPRHVRHKISWLPE